MPGVSVTVDGVEVEVKVKAAGSRDRQTKIKRILNDITFSVSRGCLAAILGPSGAGV